MTGTDVQPGVDQVNFYEEFSLDRGSDAAGIRRQLSGLLQQWRAKEDRGRGEQAKRAPDVIALIEQALEVFADDDTKVRYDLSLERDVHEKPQEVDWLTRAWNYYLQGDFGAAGVAARKARQQSPASASGYVISAWVHLGEGEARQARHYADEAFVVDQDSGGEEFVDVHLVRGATMARLGEYGRALEYLDKALSKARGGERAAIHLERAGALQRLGRFEEAMDACWAGLAAASVDAPSTLRAALINQADDMCRQHVIGLLGSLRIENVDRAGGFVQGRQQMVPGAGLDEPTASALSESLLEIDAKLAELHQLVARRDVLAEVSAPAQAHVSSPIKPLFLGVVALPLALVAWPLLGVVAILIGVGIIRLVRRSDQRAKVKRWKAAQGELQHVCPRIDMLRAVIAPA